MDFLCFTPRMKSRIAALSALVFLILISPVFASGKKENKASVTFHIQTEETDNPKMIFPQMANGKTRYFRRLPEISTKDIVSFRPFPSDAGGEDYGIVFRLKSNAVNRLAAITAANQGRWLVAQLNGRVVDGVMIDKQVSDGFIVIWKGATVGDIGLLDHDMPRIGAEGQKKK
jgi:hypothetical protein